MTDIFYTDAEFDKNHKLKQVDKKVAKLVIKKAGADLQLLWFDIFLEDGTHIQTGYYQEI